MSDDKPDSIDDVDDILDHSAQFLGQFHGDEDFDLTRDERIDLLIDRIEEFLREREPELTMGWPRVEDEEVYDLSNIIYMLTVIKWGEDPDGDRAVEHVLSNRTKQQSIRYVTPVPYLKDEDGETVHRLEDAAPESAYQHMRAVMLNYNQFQRKAKKVLERVERRFQREADSEGE